jgi:membrane protein required for colicin V production
MQTYDILMLIVLAAATIFGAIKGFAWQVASLASIVVSLVVASYFRHDVAKMINAEPPWNMFLAMLMLFFGSSLAIWLVFRMISGTIDKIKLKEFDRQLGAGFGLLKGAVFCCVITMFAMTLLGPNQQHAIASSRSGYYISQALAKAGSILPQEVRQVIGPHIDRVNQQLEQGRDPNYVPDPNAPRLNPNVDAWGRAIDARMTELGGGLFPTQPPNAGPAGAAPANAGQANAGQGSTRPDGGVLSRFFQSGGSSGASVPSTSFPSTTPSSTNPPGWPVSSPTNPGDLLPSNPAPPPPYRGG